MRSSRPRVLARKPRIGDTAGHQQHVSVSALADGWSAGRSRGGRSRSRSVGLRAVPLGTPSEREGTMPSQPTPAYSAPAEDDARYRPDPGRETRLTIDSFLHALAAAEPGDP